MALQNTRFYSPRLQSLRVPLYVHWLTSRRGQNICRYCLRHKIQWWCYVCFCSIALTRIALLPALCTPLNVVKSRPANLRLPNREIPDIVSVRELFWLIKLSGGHSITHIHVHVLYYYCLGRIVNITDPFIISGAMSTHELHVHVKQQLSPPGCGVFISQLVLYAKVCF